MVNEIVKKYNPSTYSKDFNVFIDKTTPPSYNSSKETFMSQTRKG